MSYLALYRKYRPKTFEDVIGQDHITSSLKNQIKNNEISHAYLFTGTRGTGKTSIAKIFARAVNCLSPKDGSPCENCTCCNELSKENNVDILEIDAASNNGVDNIRELRDKVKYPPVIGKYKVYIIDEVHMLSDSAFNALLKTLEEPPSYVIFILATTEVHKLPATILSRCLRFDFKLVDTLLLSKHISQIFDKEHIQYDKEAVYEIAKLGEGSVRDALSVADMCVAYGNKHVTYDVVMEAVGATSKDSLINVVTALINKDKGAILSEIDKVSKLGKNIGQFSYDLASFLRDIAVVMTANNYSEILNYPQDILTVIQDLSKKANINEILELISTLAKLETEYKYAINPRLILEIALLNFCSNSYSELTNRVDKLEKEINKTVSKASLIKDSETIISEQAIEAAEQSEFSARQIFGKLCVMLREQNECALMAAFGGIKSYELNNNTFTIYTVTELENKMFTKLENRQVLIGLLKQIDDKLDLKIIKQEDIVIEKSFLDKLKEKFENYLIIS